MFDLISCFHAANFLVAFDHVVVPKTFACIVFSVFAVGVPENSRRGALAVLVNGVSSTSGFDRASPLPYIILANDSSSAGFSVTLGDDPVAPRISATFNFLLDVANPRALQVNVSVAAVTSFQASLVAISAAFSPPNTICWYSRGVRQGLRWIWHIFWDRSLGNKPILSG